MEETDFEQSKGLLLRLCKNVEKIGFSQIKNKRKENNMNYNYLVPSCEILVNGQKRKLYGKNKDKVYLNDGDEFQLKVFNPFTDRIGFQLKMNGSESDNAILVINPGQSVIVERFIGTNRKLKFGSYLVDKNNPLTKGAIKDNGKLDIVFWDEYKPVTYIPYRPCSPPYIPYVPYVSPVTTPYPYYTQPFSWDTINICDSTFDSQGLYSNTKGVNIKGDLNVSGNIRVNGLNLNESLSETGRIEKGKKSNQHFYF